MQMIQQSLKFFAQMFLIITVIFTVFLYLLAIVLGPALFFFTSDGLEISGRYLQGLPIWLLNVRIYIPVGIEFGIIFITIWIIFTLSFITAWKVKENFLKTIKENITKPTKKLFRSSLFALPIINSMTLIAVIVIHSLQEAGGIPTGISPIDNNPFLDLIDLSYAAVSEEVGFRIIPIGALLIIYLLVINKNEKKISFKQKTRIFIMSFIFPDEAKKIVGEKTVSENGLLGGISLGEWGIVILTSVIFGLAHFNPGVSWEIGKVTSAGFTGLILSLSYLVYGAHASIIMHWFFNTYNDTYLLFSKSYSAATPFANSAIIISVLLGIFGWLMLAALAVLSLQKLKKRKMKDLF
jgi:hypothetical protein